MSSWDACISEPNPILKWIECHPASAGWLQAIGAIIAIAAAYLIARYQLQVAQQQEALRQKGKARALAYQLIPAVAHITVNSKAIDYTIKNDDYGMALLTPALSTTHRAVRAMSFSVQSNPRLLEQIDVLPSDAALAVVQLFSFVDDFDNFVSEYLPQALLFDPEMRTAYITDIEAKFSAIQTAETNVSKMLNEIAQ